MKIAEIAQRLEGRSGFFSYDTLVNFENMKDKPILVLGYSGSGKTPIAESLARKFKREVISTDTLWWELQKNGTLQEENKEEFYALLQKLIYSNQNIVIEGIHLFEILQNNKEKFLSLPLVLLGTSLHLSTLKAFARDGIFKMDFLQDKHRKNTEDIAAIFADVRRHVATLPQAKIQTVRRKALLCSNR